jgi:hypothetical protein
MAGGGADRAQEIIFGHWKAEFSSWFARAATHPSVPVNAAVAGELAAALFEAQRYVLQRSVEIDLQLFAPSGVLYRDLTGSPEKLAELFGILDDSDKVQALRADAAPVTRTQAQAYDYYCTTILNPPTINQDWWSALVQKVLRRPSLGLDAFVKRQPQTKALLDRVAKNFRDNIEECLTRVRADKKALETCFLDGATITRITKIDSPGSDPHKGGKRVAILTFDYRSRQGGTAQRRIVCKPSDVEIDYRLAGRNTPEVRAFLEGCERTSDKAGYPAPPYESLYEFVDRVVLRSLNQAVAEVAASSKGARDTEAFATEKARVLAMLALPSYVILPRNPGSRLPSTGSPPIRSSYGYLEYLTHEPSPLPPFGTGLDRYVLDRARANGGIDPQWDWITEHADEARACYRLWGRLMVIACLFLQTDLHWDNQRVRRRKPHLIDLENCLVKKADALTDTLITGAYTRQTHGLEPWWEPRVRAANDPADTPLDREPHPPGEGYNVNQLFFHTNGKRGAQAWQVQTFEHPAQPREIAGMSLEVLKGIAECVRAMRSRRTELQAWIDEIGLGKCIVRHVVRRTEDFNRDIQRFVDTMLGEQLEPSSERRDQKTLFDEFMARQAEIASRDWEAQNRPGGNRCFLLETADRNGRDYENLDVPAWYRRVDSTAILSSEGRPVADYYDKTGLDLLRDSFAAKLVDDPRQAQAVLNRFKAFLQRDLPEVMGKSRR